MKAVYSMGAVTRRTGLSAHVVRVWERRHRAVSPTRTGTNQRVYREADVVRLELLRDLVAEGHAIGQIASLETARLRRLLGEAAPTPEGTPVVVEAYLGAIDAFDAQAAFDVLGRAAASLDRRVFLYEVALPVLRASGDAWARGRFSVAQEHLVSAQLEGVLHGLRGWGGAGPRVLISTPSGHRHAFGAMAAALLAGARGFQPIYLGADLPAADLLDAVRLARPRLLVLTVLGQPTDAEARALEGLLAEVAPEVETWVGGPKGHPAGASRSGVHFFDDLKGFERALEAVTRAVAPD